MAELAVLAFPVIFPSIGFVTFKLVNSPTLVKLDPVIVAFSVVPLKVAASADAVMLISALPSKSISLIFLGVANLVAVLALMAELAVLAFPVISPAIGFVTVKFAKVPTLVKLDPVTVAFSIVPLKVAASADAVILISALPSNSISFIFLEVANLVAVDAIPAILAVLAFPVISPTIGFITVKFAKVPTLVKLDPVTVAFSVVPLKVAASAIPTFTLFRST